jgi:septum formation protein
MFNHPVHKFIKQYEFILCSNSPRRLDILKQIGFNPIIKKSNFKEDLDKSLYIGKPIDYVKDTSYFKLIDVFESIKKDKKDKSIILLSADTVIISGDKILEKPDNYENNIKMIKTLRNLQLNGEIIKIVTCCTLLKFKNNEKIIKKFECSTEIKLIDNISDELIEQYCQSGEGLEVAGGFKIQGYGAILFDSINGDFYNCVGLPASKVFNEINDLINE